MAKKATKGKSKAPAKKPAKKAPAKKPPAKKAAAAQKAAAKKPAKKGRIDASGASDAQTLREELQAARQELARLAREENVVKRDLEAGLSSERAANERLRAELDAVRLDLKTALADLEIARAEHQRMDGKAHAAAKDLVHAHEAQRMAEHAAAEMREQFYEVRSNCDTLRDENEKLRAELAAATGGSPAQEPAPTSSSAEGSGTPPVAAG